MRYLPLVSSRSALRLALLAATALTLTGCADSSRLADPFGNPFGSSEQVDRSPTGSVPPPVRKQERIIGQPLAAPQQTASVAPSNPSPAPATSAPAESRAPVASFSNWTSQGGTPIVMAQGESVKVLSDRYGVPAEALVRTNGFSSASQITPGTRLVIPVYSVNAARTAQAAPPPTRVAEPVKPQVAARTPTPVRETPQARHETLKLVKGPQPAARTAQREEPKVEAKKPAQTAKASLIERTKVARAKVEAEPAPTPAKAKTTPPVKQAIVREEIKPAPKVAPEKPAREEKVATREEKKTVDPAPTASLPPATPAKTADSSAPEFRWPARGRVIQGFKAGGNDGINIAVPEGTAVKAAEDGVVAYAGSELKGYGNLVLVRHPNGFVSAYANNGSLDVKRGDTVKRGQTIAKSGQSGNVSSPQLHFELRKGAQPVDPSAYLAGN